MDSDHPQVGSRGIVAKMRGVLDDFGWRAGLLYLIDRALRAVTPRAGLFVYELMAQPVPEKPLLRPNMLKGLRFEEIVPAHRDMARMHARPEILAARVAQRARCLGLYRDDELLGFVWFASGQYPEDEVRCDFVLDPAVPAVFDFDFYLFPESRMGIGFMALWHGANEFLRAQGVKVSYSRMTRFNLASRRAHARLGAKCIGRATFLKIGRFELMVADRAPYVAMGLHRRVRMTMAMPRPVTSEATDARR